MPSSPGNLNLIAVIGGVNVALATTLCTACTMMGHSEMALPVCGMVTGVYGISSGIQTIVSNLNDRREDRGCKDD